MPDNPRWGEFGHGTWEDDPWECTRDVGSWVPVSPDPGLGLVFPVTKTGFNHYCGGHRPILQWVDKHSGEEPGRVEPPGAHEHRADDLDPRGPAVPGFPLAGQGHDAELVTLALHEDG